MTTTNHDNGLSVADMICIFGICCISQCITGPDVSKIEKKVTDQTSTIVALKSEVASLEIAINKLAVVSPSSHTPSVEAVSPLEKFAVCAAIPHKKNGENDNDDFASAYKVCGLGTNLATFMPADDDSRKKSTFIIDGARGIGRDGYKKIAECLKRNMRLTPESPKQVWVISFEKPTDDMCRLPKPLATPKH
jgi:hypothetical protein